VRRGLLHIVSNLSMDERVRLLLPPTPGLLTLLVRTLLEDAAALQARAPVPAGPSGGDYEYHAGLSPASKSTEALAEDKDGNHPDGVSVLRVGGQVGFQSDGEF
jgi:hypothetical protein